MCVCVCVCKSHLNNKQIFMVITNPTAHGKTSQHPPICSNQPASGRQGTDFAKTKRNMGTYWDVLFSTVYVCVRVCACLVLLSCSVLVPSLAVGKVPQLICEALCVRARPDRARDDRAGCFFPAFDSWLAGKHGRRRIRKGDF